MIKNETMRSGLKALALAASLAAMGFSTHASAARQLDLRGATMEARLETGISAIGWPQNSVPEAGAWAIMLTGLFGMASMLHSRRKLATAPI